MLMMTLAYSHARIMQAPYRLMSERGNDYRRTPEPAREEPGPPALEEPERVTEREEPAEEPERATEREEPAEEPEREDDGTFCTVQ
jgi:hypothetical protein